jgi:hypothetical protein
MSKPYIWTVGVVCAVVFGLTSAGGSMPKDKVDICHFAEETGTWKLISVGAPATRAHLENHNDAIPGGTTSKTGTALDAECKEVTCPCDYSAENLLRLGITGVADGCIVTDTGAVLGTDCLFGPPGPTGCSGPLINVQATARSCSIRADPIFSDILDLTAAELQACRDDVIQAAQALGITCVQR